MKPESVLYQTFVEAEQLRRQALKDGASKLIADAIVADALKAAWPKGREEPWHYLCETCDDIGWRYANCPGDATCGRKNLHQTHTYVQPCWCAKGRAFRAKKSCEIDLETIGKTQKKPSRFLP